MTARPGTDPVPGHMYSSNPTTHKMVVENLWRVAPGEGDDVRLFAELVDAGLFMAQAQNFDLLDPAEVNKALNFACNKEKIPLMVEHHDARASDSKGQAHKGPWFGSGGRVFSQHTANTLGKHEVITIFFSWIKESFRAEIVDYFISYFDPDDAKTTAEILQILNGSFGPHRDNFADKHMRLATTLGNPKEGWKTMTFIKDFRSEDERSVTIWVPHGTIIGMTQKVSGADHATEGGEGRYWHRVDGGTGTYTLGLQLVVGGDTLKNLAENN
ncbi:hypothetical protein ACHAXT_001996 [Thalassiosira profunda]